MRKQYFCNSYVLNNPNCDIFKYSTNYTGCAYYELYDYKNLYCWYEEYTFNGSLRTKVF